MLALDATFIAVALVAVFLIFKPITDALAALEDEDEFWGDDVRVTIRPLSGGATTSGEQFGSETAPPLSRRDDPLHVIGGSKGP